MDMNTETPKSINNTYSVKNATLISLESIKRTLAEEYDTNVQVLLFTAYGFIKCDIDFDKPTNNIFATTGQENIYKVNLNSLNIYRNAYVNEVESDNPDVKPIDNGSSLHLKNVTIYSNAMTASMAHPSVTFDSFVIFVDQIIGFSLTPRTVEE